MTEGERVQQPQGHVISASSLNAMLGDPKLVVLDARWSIDSDEAGRRAYAVGHVPGAAYVHLNDDLSDLRDPVPGQMRPITELVQLFQALGVGEDSLVVAYDDDVIYTASRVVWMLATIGHGKAAVLNGGWPAWLRSGGIVSTEPAHAEGTGKLVAAPKLELRRTRADVERALLRGTKLIDCRMDETWEAAGEHIPGATRLPAPSLTGDDGALEAAERTRERALELGLSSDDEVILYCGGGISASRVWLALTRAEFRDVAVYDGSWAEWSSDPSLPRDAH